MIMTIVEVDKVKILVICLRGKLISILGSGTGGMGAEGSVGVVNENTRGRNKIGDIFVPVVKVKKVSEGREKTSGRVAMGSVGSQT